MRIGPRLDASVGPPPLSRRERQVADLVAEGLTDRAIAAQLGVSARTAESHVARILTKLGVANRVQVATWVLRMRGAAEAA